MLNDAQYTQNGVGRPSSLERVATPHLFRRNTVGFYEIVVCLNVRDLRGYTVVQINALRNIPARAELFDNYGPAY